MSPYAHWTPNTGTSELPLPLPLPRLSRDELDATQAIAFPWGRPEVPAVHLSPRARLRRRWRAVCSSRFARDVRAVNAVSRGALGKAGAAVGLAAAAYGVWLVLVWVLAWVVLP